MSDPKKTDVEQELADLKVKLGEWGAAGDKTITPSAATRQAGTLLRMKDLLEEMAKGDRDSIDDLKEKLSRIRHGGGS